MRLRYLLSLSLVASCATPPAFVSSRAPASDPSASSQSTALLPEFTDTVTVLESQSVQGAQPVFWDQSLADLMGIKTPPGRVGQPEFDKWLVENFAFEVKAGARQFPAKEEYVEAAKTLSSNPLLFVENDAHGGSGRAGYIKVQDKAWVNIKGIGLTGMGNAKGRTVGPPSTSFSSHSDGSATLEEAIKEAVNAEISDNEMKRGASRVLGIIYTGRTITYQDGNKVPLAMIIRAPLRRLDREAANKASLWARVTGTAKSLSPDQIKFNNADTIAQANAMRIMKGDLVNSSNIGAGGELIDFGCLTHTCGYSPVKSSQDVSLFHENRYLDVNEYRRKQSFYLLNQMGVPEADLQAGLSNMSDADERLANMTDQFQSFLAAVDPKVETLDFSPIAKDRLEGKLKMHVMLRDLAADFFAEPATTSAQFSSDQLAKWKRLAAQGWKEIPAESVKTVESSVQDFLLEVARILNKVRDEIPAEKLSSYAEAIRKVAHFKNRDIEAIVRPNLFNSAGSATRNFEQTKDGPAIDGFIREMVLDHKLGTGASGDGHIAIRADDKKTEVFVRAYRDAAGTEKLFSHPELTGAAKDEEFMFRVSTDGWKTHKDFATSFVETSYGTYLHFEIPHGAMPVTDVRVELSPFVKDAQGGVRYFANGFNIRGPVLLLNERLGLKPNLDRIPDIMRTRYSIPISRVAEDMKVLKTHRSGAVDLSCRQALGALLKVL